MVIRGQRSYTFVHVPARCGCDKSGCDEVHKKEIGLE